MAFLGGKPKQPVTAVGINDSGIIRSITPPLSSVDVESWEVVDSPQSPLPPRRKSTDINDLDPFSINGQKRPNLQLHSPGQFIPRTPPAGPAASPVLPSASVAAMPPRPPSPLTAPAVAAMATKQDEKQARDPSKCATYDCLNFFGITIWRHTCTKCNEKFCSTCCAERINDQGGKIGLICNECHYSRKPRRFSVKPGRWQQTKIFKYNSGIKIVNSVTLLGFFGKDALVYMPDEHSLCLQTPEKIRSMCPYQRHDKANGRWEVLAIHNIALALQDERVLTVGTSCVSPGMNILKIWRHIKGQDTFLPELETETLSDKVICAIQQQNTNILLVTEQGGFQVWSRELKFLKGINLNPNKLAEYYPIRCILDLPNELVALGTCTEGNKGAIQLIHLDSRTLYNQFTVHSKQVTSLLRLTNGDIVSGSSNGSVKLHKFKPDYITRIDCKLLLDSSTPAPIINLRQLRDGKIVALRKDGKIFVWDAEGNKLPGLDPALPIPNNVKAIYTTQDGELIIAQNYSPDTINFISLGFS